MIQDIFPYKLDNRYKKDAVPEAEDRVLCFSGMKLLMKEAGASAEYKMMFPKVKDFSGGTVFTYLFSVDAQGFFLTSDPGELPPGTQYLEINALRRERLMPRHLNFAAMTGKHLSDWYRDARFCGRCGCKTEHSKKERAMVCPACGYTAYPRIMPAVIVGVINGEKLLLTRYRTGFKSNALIAGFTEIGETAEETVAREVMEEAGIQVKNIRYYKSQPWGIANDLLMGFYCDVDGNTEIHMDREELKYAQWVTREEIELQPDDFSLTNEMMKMFKDGIVR